MPAMSDWRGTLAMNRKTIPTPTRPSPTKRMRLNASHALLRP
jgi:hypothetical protein